MRLSSSADARYATTKGVKHGRILRHLTTGLCPPSLPHGGVMVELDHPYLFTNVLKVWQKCVLLWISSAVSVILPPRPPFWWPPWWVLQVRSWSCSRPRSESCPAGWFPGPAAAHLHAADRSALLLHLKHTQRQPGDPSQQQDSWLIATISVPSCENNSLNRYFHLWKPKTVRQVIFKISFDHFLCFCCNTNYGHMRLKCTPTPSLT